MIRPALKIQEISIKYKTMNIVSLYPYPFDGQFRHEPNVSVWSNGKIFSYEEDKFTKLKSDPTAPFAERALMRALCEFELMPEDVDLWVFPNIPGGIDRPLAKKFFVDLLKIQSATDDFEKFLFDRLLLVRHHDAHAYSTIFASGVSKGYYLTYDGGGDFGDRRNMTFGRFDVSKPRVLDQLAEQTETGNLCTFHSFVTDACGFYGENGKTSGLAAYGSINASCVNELVGLFSADPFGVFHRVRRRRSKLRPSACNAEAFDRNKIYNTVPSETNVVDIAKRYDLFDFAASGEYVVQEMFLALANKLSSDHRIDSGDLCVAGGLFNNVSLNYRLSDYWRNKGRVHFCMAPSDAGLSLGGLYFGLHQRMHPHIENSSSPVSPFLGPEYSSEYIESVLKSNRCVYQKFDSSAEVLSLMREDIVRNKIIGIFRGRAELGPRSLGARSILSSSKNVNAKRLLNLYLKRRDWFMPYAPIIAEELADKLLPTRFHNYYMQLAVKCSPKLRERLGYGVHVDGSARIQVLRRADNPFLHSLIRSLEEYGIYSLLNTSFNRHGISTVGTPLSAIQHLLSGCFDVLYIENFMVRLEANRIMPEINLSEELDELEMMEIERNEWRARFEGL